VVAVGASLPAADLEACELRCPSEPGAWREATLPVRALVFPFLFYILCSAGDCACPCSSVYTAFDVLMGTLLGTWSTTLMQFPAILGGCGGGGYRGLTAYLLCLPDSTVRAVTSALLPTLVTTVSVLLPACSTVCP